MASSDFLLWDASSTNQASQSTYAASSDLANGVANGEVASSLISNKLFRQASAGMAVLGQFILAQSAVNVVDNGNLSTLVSQFEAALTAFVASQSLFRVAKTTPTNPALGTTVSQAHGLGSIPLVFLQMLWLENINPEGGYSANDRVVAGMDNQSGTYSSWFNATNFGFALSSSYALGVANKSTGAPFSINPTNWYCWSSLLFIGT